MFLTSCQWTLIDDLNWFILFFTSLWRPLICLPFFESANTDASMKLQFRGHRTLSSNISVAYHFCSRWILSMSTEAKSNFSFFFWLISQSSKFLMCFVMQIHRQYFHMHRHTSGWKMIERIKNNTNIWVGKSAIKFYCPWFWTNQNITTTTNIIKIYPRKK